MMLPLVEIPEIVRHYESFFTEVFSPAALEQFKRYVSGLIVSYNKTVEGINRLFVFDVRHQSSLNRLLTESPFSISKLHQARLALLSSIPQTQMKRKGVLSIDDTLLTHYGQHFEKITPLYDSVHQCYVWAHNLVNLHYSDDDTDYPVDFALWEPTDVDALEKGLVAAGRSLRESKYSLKQSDPKKWRSYLVGVWRRHQHKPAVGALYQSKLHLAQHLLAQFVANYPDQNLPVTFDSWYTQPAFCRYVDKTLKRAYVGTLDGDARVKLTSGEHPLSIFDQSLQARHQAAIEAGKQPLFKKLSITYKGEKEHYYSYCKTHRIATFGKQRLVINHQKADLSDPPRLFISNRLNWQAGGITRIRRHRWPVEVYHEKGKAEGLDQYQVRDFEAIKKHIALVTVTYSLLRAAQHDRVLLQKLQQHIETTLGGSVPTARRITQAQALWALATFTATALAQGQSLQQIMQPVLATLTY